MFEATKIEDVAPQEVDALCEQGALLLDVREDDEWAAGHAPGAVHMPLAGVTDATAQFAGRQVLAVCRSGGRSGKAAATLAEAGVEVRNVAGGMSSWAEAGLPVVRDDGSPGSVA